MNARTIQREIFYSVRSASQIVMPNFTPCKWFECDVWRVTSSGLAVEYEIKLTVSDFRADARKRGPSKGVAVDGRWEYVAQPTKHGRLAQADPRGPSRFFYAVPEDMADIEVPSWAGLIVARPCGANRAVLSTKKPAPKLHHHLADDRSIAVARRNCYYRMWAYLGCAEADPAADMSVEFEAGADSPAESGKSL